MHILVEYLTCVAAMQLKVSTFRTTEIRFNISHEETYEEDEAQPQVRLIPEANVLLAKPNQSVDEQGAYMHTSEKTCSVLLFVFALLSSVFAAVAWCVGLTCGTAFVEVCNLLLLFPALYTRVLTTMLSGKRVHKTCYMFITCEIVSFSLVAFLVVASYLKLHRTIAMCMFPACAEALTARWLAVHPTICGPALEFYNSPQYNTICKEAICEVSGRHVKNNSVQELRLAVGKIVHDDNWPPGRWLEILMFVHQDALFPEDKYLELVKQTAAVVMETQGCGIPVLYDMRILQLSATPNHVQLEEVENTFSVLSRQWDPFMRGGVSSDSTFVDYACIHASYENVKAYLKARDTNQASTK